MTQAERRIILIQRLLDEQPRYQGAPIPRDKTEQKNLLRSLLNVRMPKSIGDEFLTVQDEYLREETAAKGVTDLANLSPISEGLYLWRGDITTLRCGAIVNAANSGMTGCYQPCHNCIDNCIHTYAGVQLRLKCAELMAQQGYEEPTGQAKITPAYNLPCQYVIHTVGPIGQPILQHVADLALRHPAAGVNVAVRQDRDMAVAAVAAAVDHAVLRRFGDLKRSGFVLIQRPKMVFLVEVDVAALGAGIVRQSGSFRQSSPASSIAFSTSISG